MNDNYEEPWKSRFISHDLEKKIVKEGIFSFFIFLFPKLGFILTEDSQR